jgi:hypothetical protein
MSTHGERYRHTRRGAQTQPMIGCIWPMDGRRVKSSSQFNRE